MTPSWHAANSAMARPCTSCSSADRTYTMRLGCTMAGITLASVSSCVQRPQGAGTNQGLATIKAEALAWVFARGAGWAREQRSAAKPENTTQRAAHANTSGAWRLLSLKLEYMAWSGERHRTRIRTLEKHAVLQIAKDVVCGSQRAPAPAQRKEKQHLRKTNCLRKRLHNSAHRVCDKQHTKRAPDSPHS